MFDIDQRLKELYQADSTDKHLVLDFYRPGADTPFLHLLSENIESESLELSESLGSGENLDFGSCEAAQMKITLIDVSDTVKNSHMVAYQVIEGIFPADDLFPGGDVFPSGYVMPMGRYVVQSAEKQSNRRYLDIVALDFMSKFGIDVSAWYNNLSFPISLREFRSSLCRHVGVTELVPDYLPNDNMPVEKTVDAAELIGRQVLIACEQANGAFGHFDRTGILRHIVLQPNSGLYPGDDIYPGNDIFPTLPGGLNTQMYDETLEPYLMISAYFEEYTVQSIDKVQIRQEEGDIGALYGDGTNVYTVEGNFLLYGKNATELEQIAQGIYGMVSGRLYVPYESESKGLPYIEVGDTLKFNFGEESIISYVLKRTLKGIYALRDNYGAEGEEIRGVETDINKEIIQLKGKAAFLVKTVDEVSARVIDIAENTEAQLKITAEQIESTVRRVNEAESLIRQTAEQIALKVSKGEVSAQISIESGGVNITGNRFSWTSTNSSMSADGTLNCKNGIFSGRIEASEGRIGGFVVDGNSLSAKSNRDASIDFGTVIIDDTGLQTGNWWFSNDEISCLDYIIANDNGNVFVYNSSYYNKWAIGRALDDLRRRIGGGGGCGSDCDDTCDDSGCNSDALIDDIGGC